MGTRTSDKDTILFIRSAERSHSGKYTLSVQIENMSDSADIHIQVVGQSHHGTNTSPDLIACSLIKIRTPCMVHTSQGTLNNLCRRG